MCGRYINKKTDTKVREKCGFRCANCGVNLTERHHIEEYYKTQDNSEKNLILLCPTCHTEVHNGKISQDELRALELDGKIDKDSGSLSMNSKNVTVNIGSNTFVNCKNIIKTDQNSILRLSEQNQRLLVSLKLFDCEGGLVCWMSDNRWWVHNPSILDFIHNKKGLKIFNNKQEKILDIEINGEEVQISAKMWIDGAELTIDDNKVIYKGKSMMVMSNNSIENVDTALYI